MEESQTASPADKADPSFRLLCPCFAKARSYLHSRQMCAALLANATCHTNSCLLTMVRLTTAGSVITAEAKTSQAMRALRLSRNFGKESALCAGLEHTRGDAVIVMDADGQHPPSLIPEMVRMWQSSGADIVEAVKRRTRPRIVIQQIWCVCFSISS